MGKKKDRKKGTKKDVEKLKKEDRQRKKKKGGKKDKRSKEKEKLEMALASDTTEGPSEVAPIAAVALQAPTEGDESQMQPTVTEPDPL